MTVVGSGCGCIASLGLPAFMMLLELLDRQSVWTVARWAEFFRTVWPLWAVTFPGAVLAGALLGVTIERGVLRARVPIAFTGLAAGLLNASLGGLLNLLLGNPCQIHGTATDTPFGALLGGAVGFLVFFPVTIPVSLATPLLIRHISLSRMSRAGPSAG
jgi:hypothetical protein